MQRTTFLVLAAGLMAISAVASSALAQGSQSPESPILLQTPTGTLHGTLTLPPKLPAPVVLIVAGSGAVDRDGNAGTVLHTDAYKLLAGALAARGIASVRYDKRGIAASAAAASSEADLRFTNYVNDAAAWLRLLRADPRFTKIAVAGHSEGSLVGMLALQQAPGDAFVSLEGAGRPLSVVLREQLKRNLDEGYLSRDLYSQSDAILTQLQQGRMVPNPPAQLAVLFRPSVQPYLISLFALNPAMEIAKLHVPVTIVQGSSDIQVTMDDARALTTADPSARLVVVNGMNHVLKHAPDTSSRAAIVAGYENQLLPLAPEAIDAVAAFAR